jgi:hypothetical protein
MARSGQAVPAGGRVVQDHPGVDDREVGDGAPDHGGVAERDHARGDVAGDHRAGADEGAGADAHVGQDGHVDADLRARADPGAGHQLGGSLVAGVQVVGDRDPGGEEHVVFEFGVLRHVAVAVDLDPVPDPAAVVHHGVAPDGHVVAELAAFADDHAVAGLQPAPDRGAVVQDGPGPEPGSGPEDQRPGVAARHRVPDDHAGVAAGRRAARVTRHRRAPGRRSVARGCR